MDKISLPPYFALVFPVAFVALWCGILLLLSRIGGWHRLAADFTAKVPPRGTRFGMQSARVGWVNYNSCRTIYSSPEGLHISVWSVCRPGHPALFLPWDVIRNVHQRRFLWWKFVQCEVAGSSTVKLSPGAKVLEGRMLPQAP